MLFDEDDPEGHPVDSFQSLLADLATFTRNTIVPNISGAPGWQQDTKAAHSKPPPSNS